MRRRGIIFLALIGLVAILFVTSSLAYRAGLTTGAAQVAEARSAYQTQIARAPTAPAGGGAPGTGQSGGNATRPAGQGQGSAPAGGPRPGGNLTPGAASAPAGTPRP